MTRTHEIKLDGYGAHTTLAEDRPIMLLGTAESYGIEMLHVVAGSSWEGLTVTATFNAPDGTSTDMLMDADGSITVPSEATSKSGSGKIVFTGVSDGVQRISCDLEYFVVAHSAINGVQSGGTAPSWFEQAVTRFMPTGGTAGQVLTKLTDTDFEAEWQDSKGGAGLEPLVGTNKTLTPTQVREAFLQGQPIVFSFIDALGEVAFIFQSFEIYDDIIVASTILPRFDSQGMGVGLVIGYLLSNVWEISETEITNPDDIQTAINTALAAAKASGEFDGLDGITPTIGDNGNWYLGATDTGKPSRGEKGDTGATGATGTDGKSAFSYAQDGGYSGTEAEFAAKLAAEKLPNPYPLTFTGAVNETYDGSSAKTIEIPSGGGAAASGLGIYDNYDVTLISFAQIDQATLPIDAGIEITTDDNGNPFSYDGLVVWTDIKSGISYTDIDFNNVKNCHYPIQHGVKDSMNMYVVDGTSMRAIVGSKSCVYIRQTRDDVNAAFYPASNIAQLPEKFTAIHLCPRNKVASGTFYKIWGLTKK